MDRKKKARKKEVAAWTPPAQRAAPPKARDAPPKARVAPPAAVPAPPDAKMATVFEILSAFAVDVYWNRVLAGGVGKSLEEYKKAATALLTGLRDDRKSFQMIASKLHENYTVYYGAESYAGFVRSVTSHFIPGDHFRLSSHDELDEVFSNVICDLFAQVCLVAVQPDVASTIIQPAGKDVRGMMTMLQDHGVSALLMKREDLFGLFLKKAAGGQDMQTRGVPVAAFNKLKDTLRAILKEKSEVVAKLNNEVAHRQRAEAAVRDLVRVIRRLQREKEARPDLIAERPAERRPPEHQHHYRQETIAERRVEPEDSGLAGSLVETGAEEAPEEAPEEAGEAEEAPEETEEAETEAAEETVETKEESKRSVANIPQRVTAASLVPNKIVPEDDEEDDAPILALSKRPAQ